MHDIHHQDGDVAERWTPRSEIAEGFVARGVDDQEARDLKLFLGKLKTQQIRCDQSHEVQAICEINNEYLLNQNVTHPPPKKKSKFV